MIIEWGMVPVGVGGDGGTEPFDPPPQAATVSAIAIETKPFASNNLTLEPLTLSSLNCRPSCCFRSSQ
jgi:hypothetical protein